MDDVTLGKFRGVFGVQGWLRVESFTQPAESLLNYARWCVCTRHGHSYFRPLAGRRHGPGLVVQLESEAGELIASREQAQALNGCEIRVPRAELPDLPVGQVYWVDLPGCAVYGRAGELLGTVTQVIDGPAHPILEVEGEARLLIPLVRGPIISNIDVGARRIDALWSADEAL